MSRHFEQINDALDIMKKSGELNKQRELALKRHQLSESEFEVLTQNNDVTAEKLETARSTMISLYEQYVDACLALRTFSVDANRKIEEMIKEHKKS